MARVKRRILASVAIVVVLVTVSFAVLVQQYDVWATADLDRNVEEFVPSDTLESCMDEIDGVWLPWLVTQARDMCADATRGD